MISHRDSCTCTRVPAATPPRPQHNAPGAARRRPSIKLSVSTRPAPRSAPPSNQCVSPILRYQRTKALTLAQL
eukprot:2309186-Prymnesium_polylepis.1